jgi:hypothetical protein
MCVTTSARHKAHAVVVAISVWFQLTAANNTCSGSVSNGVADAEYGACSSAESGGICTPKCRAGFRTSGASSGFTLVCNNNGDFDAAADSGDLTCTINVCSGQVWNGGHLLGADFSSCSAGETGEVCLPGCRAGYTSAGAASGFSLVCRDNGDFDAQLSVGNLVCSRNTCSGHVSNGATDADYSSCSTASTGSFCNPVCPDGYTATGATSGFALVCDENNDFDAAADDGNLVCTGNICDGQVSNSVKNADYRTCVSKTTGDTCVPVCPTGYSTTGKSDGFALVCEEDGDFNAVKDSGDLECSINSFDDELDSVVNGVPNADYSQCASTASASCMPVCLEGFTESGASNGVTLVCDEGVCDASSDNGNLACSINTCHGQVWNGVPDADYSSCSSMDTGDKCAPACPAGSTSSGSGESALVCRNSGDYDATALLGCTRLPPPRDPCLPMRGWRGQATKACSPLNVTLDPPTEASRMVGANP